MSASRRRAILFMEKPFTTAFTTAQDMMQEKICILRIIR